jgi:hypothetical protein
VCFCLTCVVRKTHGKVVVCRAPDEKRTANILAHGNLPFSRSVGLVRRGLRGRLINRRNRHLLGRSLGLQGGGDWRECEGSVAGEGLVRDGSSMVRA